MPVRAHVAGALQGVRWNPECESRPCSHLPRAKKACSCWRVDRGKMRLQPKTPWAMTAVWPTSTSSQQLISLVLVALLAQIPVLDLPVLAVLVGLGAGAGP